MNQIKCPKCGEVFTVDEKGYADIVSQIKNHEFKEEVEKREKELASKFSVETQLEINKALKEKDDEIQKLLLQNESLLNDSKMKLELTESKIKEENLNTISSLKLEIEHLKNDLQLKDKNNEIYLKEALSEKEKQIAKLSFDLNQKEKDAALNIETLKNQHSQDLKMKDEEIAFYKDLKTKMSTKLVGETLEQHCMIQFNQLRTSAFPNAYFEKDNEVSSESRSKGDFIFKDYIDGKPYVSIMFEMKNENETTATKHKNEDFFKELDKDRREKNCEYAVLVSMLEPENEFYNAGIVDVSYKYPKMYVIRPQNFIPMITILVNAAKNSIEYQNEIEEYKNQNIDISHFEEKLLDFQDKFSKNYSLASDRFKKAIEEIDKTIEHLSKVRDDLIGSERNLRLANDKAQDLSIKKLTTSNPTMKKMFDDIKK